MGKLLHDLSTNEKGLPPDTRVQFELTLTDQNVWIENRPFQAQGAKDPTIYRYRLKDICLYCPVATLSSEVCADLMKRWRSGTL